MPELPEVETTRRGIAPYIEGHQVDALILRRGDLRWPVPRILRQRLPGQTIDSIERRAKYLLLHTQVGSALLHLGMSGSLRVLEHDRPPGKHDHYDLVLDSGSILRFTDPRRFGCLLWQAHGRVHPLLAHLGPEPLSADLDGEVLWRRSRARQLAVKNFIMDQAIVVGVGNIYASEALFAAGIHPARAAGRISLARYTLLVDAIKRILAYAIERGGTTLRDFLAPDGAPGYFKQDLMVYGRAGEPCRICTTPIRSMTLGQRNTFYCASCQR